MDADRRMFGLVVGGLAPLLAAMLLVSVRSWTSPVNIALVLVVAVVAAAAVGGRAGGLVAAVIAALSFDFFHTKPYLSLRIDARDDLETTAILLAVGLIVGTVASRGQHAQASSDEQRDELIGIHRIAELAASGVPTALLVEAACSELTSLLGLRACVFEPSTGADERARIDASGAIAGRSAGYVSTRHGFELPREGVTIDVVGGGRRLGRLVLTPTPGVGTPLHTRRAAVVIADQLGAAIALDAATSPDR